MKLIIDCDTGIDDSLALLYALASTEAEVVAVTSTAGNIGARQVASTTLPCWSYVAGRTSRSPWDGKCRSFGR